MLDLDLYCDFIKKHPSLGKPVVKDFLSWNIILKHILTKYLSIHDIMSLSETCKYFYSICSSDIVWRYIYEKCFKLHDNLLRKNEFYKACQAIYANHSEDLHLQLLIKYGYPLYSFRSITKISTGAIPKQYKKLKYQIDDDSEVCLCENCQSLIPLKRNDSMANLYEKFDCSSGDAPDGDIETDYKALKTSFDTKKLTTSISQIKIRDMRMSKRSDDNDNNSGNCYQLSSLKPELKRRLALLIKHAMKYPIDWDDSLPGDSSTKYALK